MQRDLTRERREVRIAAVGDLHVDESNRGELLDVLAGINAAADYLVLAGDLTTRGRAAEAKVLVEELAGVQVPIVAVLGNHDCESGEDVEVRRILRDGGVHVLDGDGIELGGIGFVGSKGFAGGFGRGSLAPFGEPLIKRFVQESIDEALRLENALRNLHTEIKVVVLHYAPIEETVVGEPKQIYPFLGCSRYLAPLETHGATVIFHGHAHHGTPEGRTPAGIPVFNVAYPLLRAAGIGAYRVWTTRAPERRRQPEGDGGAAASPPAAAAPPASPGAVRGERRRGPRAGRRATDRVS